MRLTGLRRGTLASAAGTTLGPGGIGTASLKALHEGGNLTEWNSVNVPSPNTSNATVVADNTRAYEGTWSAKAHIDAIGTPYNSYARNLWGGVQTDSTWLNKTTGTDLWWGGAFFLPTGFHAAVNTYVSIMRWDNFSYNGLTFNGVTHLGISYATTTARWRLFRQQLGVDLETDLLGSTFTLTENAWHWIECRSRLSNVAGQALNELWLDGARVGSASTSANTYGDPLGSLRFGIVAVDQATQVNALDVWFDRCYIGPRQVGV